MKQIQERAFARRAATLLLEAALRIAPQETRDWGDAMFSELRHVEGNWPALIWSLGGAGVLAKHALIALIFPAANRSGLPSGGDLFSKEASMRKPMLAVIGSCVVASLLFFLAPVFRQAFRVSLAQWDYVVHVQTGWGPRNLSLQLAALARKAETDHDAEGLAFIAAHDPNRAEAARFAAEAVRLDANLIWVYATTGLLYEPSAGDAWIAKLTAWDPQNALPHLIAAQKIGETVKFSNEFPRGQVIANPGWDTAMDGAFHAAKLEDYGDRQRQLNHRVLSRYHVNDPFEAVDVNGWGGFPSYGVWYTERYAALLIESGKMLESRGDRHAALEKYSLVARFGQLMEPDHRFFVRKELRAADERLAALFEAEGNKAEAAFYSAHGAALDAAAEKEFKLRRSRFRGSEVSHWNALLARLSGSLLLLCGMLLLLCLLGVLIRNRSFRPSALRPSRLTLTLGFSAAVGALLSSAILFATYWPYSQLLQRFLNKGDDTALPELSSFLGDAQLPFFSELSLGSWYVRSSDEVFDFWLVVAALCALALIVAAVRYVQTRARSAAA